MHSSNLSQPYQGQESRDIAALSSDDIDDLLAGRGWGLALPAELNGYPGPTHVLELADVLDLSADQKSEIEAIKLAMSTEARRIGKAYVEAERELDAAFEAGNINETELADLTQRAADILGSLRATHLNAHLEVTPLLSDAQIALYNDKRGYGTASGDHSGHSGH